MSELPEPVADAIEIRCRHCGAEIGERCMTVVTGARRKPHALRFADARVGFHPSAGDRPGALIFDFAAERTRRLAVKNGFTG